MAGSRKFLVGMVQAGTAGLVLAALPIAGVARAVPVAGSRSGMLPLGVKAAGRLPAGGAKLASAGPIGLPPAAIAGVYGLPGMSPQSDAGAGQVIAIVDSFDDPNALADLNTFSQQYGYPQLPECTSLAASAPPCFETKFAEGKPPPPPETGPASDSRIETPLDIEWAHAEAPAAKIVLVETVSQRKPAMFGGVVAANKLPATEVSMSWAYPEFSGEESYDSDFTNPGTLYVASAGDDGHQARYPAASPDVIAVGGTTLNGCSGTSCAGFTSETAWSGSGGGTSRYEPIPGYQQDYQGPVSGASSISALTGGKRAIPDVSFDASPASGVSVYDSTPYKDQTGWFTVDGTSVGAPNWAGMLAAAATEGSTALQGDSAIYSGGYATNLRDITTGSNGTCGVACTAGPGYDQITGLGSPLESPISAWGKAIEVPGLAALNTGGDAVVTSISCPSPGNCGAGGVYQMEDEDQWAFVVSEVNGIWGDAQKVRGAAAAGGITSVSCASPGNCSAGGYSGSQQAFVVSEVNGTWGTALGVPGTAAAEASESWLQSVSCGSPGNCSAGGMYQTDGGSANEAFVVTQTGGTWGRLAEVPGTAALNTAGDAAVLSVSCGSAGNCSAGGNYQDADGTQAFVASQTGGTWATAIEVPGTAALNTSGYALVQSVSCASAGNCSAGGLYSTGTAQEAFVAGQVNGTWDTASEVQGITSGAVWPAPVSCGSPGNCSTGGYYATANSAQAFVANETNGTWGTAANLPGTRNTGDEITTISCASAGNCGAGGGSASEQAFVASETDGAWGTAARVRGLSADSSGLTSMSCPAAGDCAAGGSYTNSSGKTQAFVVSESGGQ